MTDDKGDGRDLLAEIEGFKQRGSFFRVPTPVPLKPDPAYERSFLATAGKLTDSQRFKGEGRTWDEAVSQLLDAMYDAIPLPPD